MQIVYTDKSLIIDNDAVLDIAKKCNITTETARLLYCRGFDTIDKAHKFLNPGKHGFNDPFLLSGMREAVNLISDAKAQNKNVFIFGDYDADGICAVSVLKSCLSDFGIDADFTVPERENGYGLNLDIINEFNNKKKIDLLITVDCGVSDYEVIEELKKQGITVIVTDHHEPPAVLPNTVVINPKIEGQAYPFNKLAGAGVAYKLGYALIGDRADKYLDVVSLATVADSMELVEENRDIVFEGLKLYNSGNFKPSLKYLLGDQSKQITAGTLAFNLSPRINAGGRMGDAKCALKLMTSTDEKEIRALAVKLSEYNIARQVGCDEVYLGAKRKIQENGLINNPVIMVADENWQAGFIGIVASRLVEEYVRPVIVFAKHGDDLKGSSRSVDDVNIYEAISSSKDLLITFGGHSQAAGVTISKDNFDEFYRRVNEFVKENYKNVKPTKKLYADAHIEGKFPIDFAREIERLEPFGVANKRPLFTTSVDMVKSSPIKAGSTHFSFNTDALEMLDFNGAGHVDLLSLPLEKKLVFDTNLSTFKGREYLKGYLKQIIVEGEDYSSCDLHAFSNSLKSILLDSLDESKVMPIDEEELLSENGTVFAISDVDNIGAYPFLSDIPVNFFTAQDKGVVNKLIVSPTEIPMGMNRVVWLDEPISFINTDLPTYCNYEISGYEKLEYLETDREVFGEIYNTLRSFDGCEFISSADFYEKYIPVENGYQFVFAMEVFFELGLLKIEMGKLKLVSGVKNPLTNSKIYSKVYEIRG